MTTKSTNVFKVTKELHFCYGHRLLNYDGKCAHPHGHNGRILIELTTEKLNHRGMVIDFVDIKGSLHKWIDDVLDHRMILHKEDPLLPVLKKMNEPIFIMDNNPTAENLAQLIFEHVKKQGFPVTKIQFWETPSSSAIYSEQGA